MPHGEMIHPARGARLRGNFLPSGEVCLDSHDTSVSHSHGFGACTSER